MFLARLGQRHQMLAGRNQEMYRRLGMNVCEGVTAVVLVFGIGRDDSLDDLAEKAAHNWTSVLGRQRLERVRALPPFRQRPTDEDLSVGSPGERRKDGARSVWGWTHCEDSQESQSL